MFIYLILAIQSLVSRLGTGLYSGMVISCVDSQLLAMLELDWLVSGPFSVAETPETSHVWAPS